MKTIVFDLDGTLVDSHKDITASVNYVRKRLYGLPPLSSDFLAAKLNDPGENLPRLLYGLETYEEEAKRLFELHYGKECLKNSRLFGGIASLLSLLKHRECDLFVVTNAPTHTSRLILQNNQVDRFFTDIIGADRVVRPKPHPEALFRVKKKARFDETWMIGDSVKDMLAAKSAGVRSIFVSWGYSAPDTVSPEGIRFAKSPAAIERILFKTE